MKKAVKLILITLISLTFVVNTFSLAIHVSAAEDQLAQSRVSDVLLDIMESTENDNIKVIVWLKSITNENAIIHSSEQVLETASTLYSPRELCLIPTSNPEMFDQYMSERKEALRNAFQSYTEYFADNYLNEAELVYASKYTPTIIANLSKAKIMQLAILSSVSSIDYYDDSVDEENSVVNSNNGIRTLNTENNNEPSVYYTVDQLKVILGFNTLYRVANSYGEGLKIGVLDYGYPDLSHTFFGDNITQHYDNNGQELHDHATHVMEILYKLVPDAGFYYTTYTGNFYLVASVTTLVSEIEWLIDNDVNIISCSLGLRTKKDGQYDDFNTYGSITSYIDYISYVQCVTFVKSAGNYSDLGITSGGMGYNVITVGNFNYGDNVIADDSSYYSGNTLTQKTDICAPGNISFVTTNETYSATSYATPVAASLAALTIAYIGEGDSLWCIPMNVKSILCAGTEMGQFPITDPEYKKYGAGVIHCMNTWKIMFSNTHNIYYFEPDDENMSITLYINENVSSNFALVFEKGCSDDNHTACNIADLNLLLYDSNNNLVAASQTSNNNVEIIRLADGYSGTYTLVVEQISSAQCDNEEIGTYFSIAWNCDE